MAISEAARSDLYTGLVEVLGNDRAETLMSAIPLHDLDQVATKRDIAVLDARFAGVDARFEVIDARFVGVDGRLDGIDGQLKEIRAELRFINQRIDRLFYALIAGLFVVVAAVIGVGIVG